MALACIVVVVCGGGGGGAVGAVAPPGPPGSLDCILSVTVSLLQVEKEQKTQNVFNITRVYIYIICIYNNQNRSSN